MQAHLDWLDWLGRKVRDKVTGFQGVVTTVAFDLFGCIQVGVQPEVGETSEIPGARWFDVARLVQSSSEPVMPRPDFVVTPQQIADGEKGPAEKPHR